MWKERSTGTERLLNDVRQASYSILNHIERNFGAKEQEYVTDEFAIGDPVKHRKPRMKKHLEKRKSKEPAGTIKVKKLDGWSSYYGGLVIWLV